MDKLHIKAIAGRNIKVDADWYEYGDKIDCYLTPAQFKDYVVGFLDYDIIMGEDNSQKSIDAEFVIIENPTNETEVEVKKDDLSKPRISKGPDSKKSPKKISK